MIGGGEGDVLSFTHCHVDRVVGVRESHFVNVVLEILDLLE